MVNSKILSTLRISGKSKDNMESAIKKYNEKSLLQMSESDFRRLAIELLSQMILQDKEIPIKIGDKK